MAVSGPDSFQFVNNYFVMFYIAYLRHMILHQTAVDMEHTEGSVISELNFKLFIVFTGKTYGLKTIEYGLPFLKRWFFLRKSAKQSAKQDDVPWVAECQRELEEARAHGIRLGQLNNLPPEFSTQILANCLVKPKDANAALSLLKDFVDEKHAGMHANSAEGQSMLTEYESTFGDFASMVVQFGYLALFAPACPIAPLLALLNNITEIRTDAYKICNLYRRPVWEPCAGIGAWLTVLRSLGLIAVVVNSTMICFVGSQLARGEYEKAFIIHRYASARLWIMMILMEHAVLLLRFAFDSITPTDPKWVHEAKDVLEFRREIMKTGAQVLQEDLLTMFKNGGNSAKDIFDEIDTDGSGYLETDEVRQLLKTLGRKLDDRDFRQIMKQIDADGSGRVDRQEFEDWWQLNKDDTKNARLQDVRPMFAKFDQDGSGGIDKVELRQLCRALKMRVSKLAVEDLMTEIDSDDNGLIDFEEFSTWWAKNGSEKYRALIPPAPGEGQPKEREAKYLLGVKNRERAWENRQHGVVRDGTPAVLGTPGSQHGRSESPAPLELEPEPESPHIGNVQGSWERPNRHLPPAPPPVAPRPMVPAESYRIPEPAQQRRDVPRPPPQPVEARWDWQGALRTPG
jgi:Ca2+-binding EF-hand superfamily protein